MNPLYKQIYKSKNGYRWRIKDYNGDVYVRGGEPFPQKQAATRAAIKFLKGVRELSHVFHVYTDRKKQVRFRVKSTNGRIVAVSCNSFKTSDELERTVTRLVQFSAPHSKDVIARFKYSTCNGIIPTVLLRSHEE